jgi:glycerol-3-phosphate acyltransferase PlsY
MHPLLATTLAVAAYVAGAVPWGVVLGKLKGVDPRTSGSGGTGATNTLRLLGWKFALAVFALDFAKGLVPVVLVRLLDGPTWLGALVAVLSVVGHCWSPFIGFKGGKGMATGGGAAVGLAPWLFALLGLVILVVALTRYVSLASLITALVGPSIVWVLAAMGEFPWPWAIAISVIAAIIIWQHRTNIQRLLNGTERKFGSREASSHNPAG